MIGPLGMQEMLIILVVALIVFGPRKLPQIGKTLGRSIAEFRRTSNELRSTLEREVQMEEFRAARDEASDLGKNLKDDMREGLDPKAGKAPEKAAQTAANEGSGDAAPASEADGEAAGGGSRDPAAGSSSDGSSSAGSSSAESPSAESPSAGSPSAGSSSAGSSPTESPSAGSPSAESPSAGSSPTESPSAGSPSADSSSAGSPPVAGSRPAPGEGS